MSDPIEEMARKATEEWIPTTSHFPLADATRSALAAIIARHYRELLATQKKVCSVCWTSSFDPCEADTPDAYEDGRGGWMVCAMCQTIHAAAEREKQVREAEDVLEAAKMDYGDIAGQIKWLLADRAAWMEKHLALDTQVRELVLAAERLSDLIGAAVLSVTEDNVGADLSTDLANARDAVHAILEQFKGVK